jgi:hypothetical protein
VAEISGDEKNNNGIETNIYARKKKVKMEES